MLVSVEAQNASLNNDYGTTRGPNAANSHQLVLLDLNGVEVVGSGYARTTILPADWDAAVDGQKTAIVTVSDPTGPWTTATSFLLYGSDGYDWDSAELVDPLVVPEAGTLSPVVVTVQYDSL